MKRNFTRLLIIIAPVIFSLSFASCSSTKNTKYFQDIPDSGAVKTLGNVEYHEPLVQPDDILNVVIQTLDPVTTQIINSGNIPTLVGANLGSPTVGQIAVTGYLVNKEGNIDMPIIGTVKVSGLNTAQIKDLLKTKASQYYKDPTVIVRFANFRVQVLGEVSRPGTYILPNEKVTLIDAIGLAGDLTIFGKRDNVLLVRQKNDGSKEAHRINLKKSDIFSSPYYYLQQNDVIYIEPSNAKSASLDASQTRNFTLIASALSVLIVLLSRN